MMNVMNWVDGIDGLAGSVTLVSCVVLFIHTFWGAGTDPQFTISLLPLVLGAAVLGFLPFLGYALGVIAIIGGAKIATALLVLGLPLLDGLWVTVYRVAHGRSPAEADMGHLHHRLLAAGLGQRTIVLLLSGTSAIFGALALLLPNTESKAASFVLIGFLLLTTIWWLVNRAPAQTERAPES
jgi:UDP-N-acetylmuramyl pentapeptide phosphotransferase/UDP-N-acetylglucosamine-1-phosphate transferase